MIDRVIESIRTVLELGYYAAGITLAYLAYRGLAQIKLTKDVAATNAKREAFKLAVEQCRFFAEQVVPARTDLIDVAMNNGIPFVLPTSCKIVQNEIIEIITPGRDIVADGIKLDRQLVLYMNRLEAFAMAFTSGVADDMVAYRSTAQTFCLTVPEIVPFIDWFRKNGRGRYECTIELLELWSGRLKSEALTIQKQQIEKNLEGIKQAKIKTIGSE